MELLSTVVLNQKDLTNCWALSIAGVLENSIVQLIKKKTNIRNAKKFLENSEENIVKIADSLSLYFGREINSSASGMHLDFVLDRLAYRTLFQEPLINYIQLYRDVLKENKIEIEKLDYTVKSVRKSALASNLKSGCIAVGTQVTYAYGRFFYHAIIACEVVNKNIRFKSTINPFSFEVPISSLEVDEQTYLDTFFTFEINN